MLDLLKEYSRRAEFREALAINCSDEIEFSLLAQGEYNMNFMFTHPTTGKKMLLRINMGSQMHLENQIEYEYQALKQLEVSGRTPKVYYVDNSKLVIPNGVLVMEYLPGHVMDYEKDMYIGAEILADIHATKVDNKVGLIHSVNPYREILEECDQMFQVYEKSELGTKEKKIQIRNMLNLCKERTSQMSNYEGYKCCINTELNSTNFLINDDGESYLIDWEKPLYGDPAQDLGHYLAPTTTFWKTDVILNEEETDAILDYYIKCVNERFDVADLKTRVGIFIPVTCMRGLTWSAMAWVEYQQPDKAIRNESTWKKLGEYLEQSFIDMVQKRVENI